MVARWLGAVLLALTIAPGWCAEELPSPELYVVYAITATGETPPVTTIWARQPGLGMRRLVYRDTDPDRRALLRVRGSDLLGAARAAPPTDIWMLTGPPTAPEGARERDTLVRLRLGTETVSQTVLALPPMGGQDAPYRLWNRAPLLAVSPGGRRLAVVVSRLGEERLEAGAVIVYAADAAEECRIPLPGRGLEAVDMAFSADGRQLALALAPRGREEAGPQGGLYLADLEARQVRLVHRCLADGLAWGPGPGRVTVGMRRASFPGQISVGVVVEATSGRQVEEFSLPAGAVALAYCDDNQWLAVQARTAGADAIWVQPARVGWGRRLEVEGDGKGALALLGWTRLTPVGPPQVPPRGEMEEQ